MNDKVAIFGLAVFAIAFVINGPMLIRGFQRGELPMPLLGKVTKAKHPEFFWAGMFGMIGCYPFGLWFLFMVFSS